MARYLTTTLPYVNADPHIGFALELLQADTLARLWRAQGEEVFFSTGTDEHGQKIWEAAQKKGQDVQVYVDHYAHEVEKLKDVLSLTNDAFIRTTNEHHKKAAQEMWRRCEASGDIYTKSYTGLYCVGCELYKTEKDLNEDGFCLIHPHLKPELVSEENYFFRFSKYAEELLRYLNRPEVIVPEWRLDEAANFVKGGLEDFSISRSKERLSWGVPVPGDDTQVMYVWFDALTDYVSTLGWPEDAEGNFEKFWNGGQTLQMAGKDQVRFQSLMWQAMLMSANLKNTDQVFYHGFINSGGQKMSKSLGNVISPYELVEKYGTEATRYLLLRHVHPVEDSDVTWERLDEWYTANLVNGLGNLTSRIIKMANLYGVRLTENEIDFALKRAEVDKFYVASKDALKSFRFNESLDLIWSAISWADKFIQQEEPFKKIKINPEEAKSNIESLLADLYQIATALEPFMPATSMHIRQVILSGDEIEGLFPRLQ